MTDVEPRNYKQELEALVAKIDSEGGLEYFLCGYGGLSLVPDIHGLVEYATEAKKFMDLFNEALDDICQQLEIDRE